MTGRPPTNPGAVHHLYTVPPGQQVRWVKGVGFVVLGPDREPAVLRCALTENGPWCREEPILSEINQRKSNRGPWR